MESSLPSVKVTLALKNLIRENLRLARAQFARRECIPRGRGFSQVVEGRGAGGESSKKNARTEVRKEERRGAGERRIDRKYSGGIKINSRSGEMSLDGDMYINCIRTVDAWLSSCVGCTHGCARPSYLGFRSDFTAPRKGSSQEGNSPFSGCGIGRGNPMHF